MSNLSVNYINSAAQVTRALLTAIGKSAVVYPAAFLVATASNMLLLGVVFLAVDIMRLGPGKVGIILAAWNLFYVAACLLLRPITACMKPRHSILLATAAACFFSFPLPFIRSFPAAALAVGLCGASMALFWPPLMSWMSADMEGKELNRAIGAYNVSWSLGAITGPTMAGWLGEFDAALPVLVASALFMAAACLLAGAVLALRGAPSGAAPIPRAGGIAGSPARVGTYLRFPAWLGVFIAFAAAGVVLAVFPIAAEKELGLGKKIVGFVFMSRAVMLSFGLWLMGRMRFWHFKGPQMAAGLCALALVSFALIFAESIGMVFILFGCLGILMAHAYANSQFHGLSGSSNRAFSMAIHEAVVGLGVFCGSMVGGMIYQKTGMRAVYASLALAIVLTIAIQIAIFQSHKKAAHI